MASALLGIDIGATKMAAGLVDARGRVIEVRTIPSEMRRGKEQVIRNLFRLIATYPRSTFARIGMGIIGSVDWRRGVSHTADKLPKNWRNVPLTRLVARKLKLRVSLDNDANAFALGVACKEGKAFATVFGLTLGSGVGGGLAISKRLYHGDNHWVTEIGHTTIEASSSDRCHCGQMGHLDGLAGGWGMERMYRKRSGTARSTYEIQDRLGFDRSAQHVFGVMVRSLGIGLANIIALFGPSYIGIGGGLSRIPGYIPGGIREMKKRRAGLPVTSTRIERIRHPEETTLRGAALLADRAHHLIP